eukprot:4852029-Prymnesium_polylepis.1
MHVTRRLHTGVTCGGGKALMGGRTWASRGGHLKPLRLSELVEAAIVVGGGRGGLGLQRAELVVKHAEAVMRLR